MENIPHYMRQSLANYIIHGAPVGDFLAAVLSNDLMRASGKADEGNKAALHHYAIYLFNHTPANCYGSKEAMESWIRHHGMVGLEE